MNSEIMLDQRRLLESWQLAALGERVSPSVDHEGGSLYSGEKDSVPPVLVVDDKQENRYSFRKVLEQAAFSVVEAASGMEALQYLLKNEASLILIDVQMPDMDGFETVQAIREKQRFRDVPILFVTAVHRSEDFAHYGFSVGAHDYLTKPVDNRLLINKVKLFHTLYRQQKLLEQNNLALQQAQAARKKAEAREQYAAYRTGVAEMSTQVLHHIGNSITGIEGAFGEIKRMTHFLGEFQALFQQVVERLSEAEREGNQEVVESASRTLLETSRELPELFRKEVLEPMEQPVQNLELGIRYITDAIRVQRRGCEKSLQNHAKFSLFELIEDLKILFSDHIDSVGVKVEEVFAVDEEWVTLPRNQLLEVLSAVLLNSLEAIEQQIEDGTLLPEQGKIQIRCRQLDTQLRIEIEDNGQGFPPEQVSELFRFGFSTRADHVGAGLHIASNFATSCRGELRIESEGVGAGARCTILLPLSPALPH